MDGQLYCRTARSGALEQTFGGGGDLLRRDGRQAPEIAGRADALIAGPARQPEHLDGFHAY